MTAKICGWCRHVIRGGTMPASTGICGSCRERQLERRRVEQVRADDLARPAGIFRALWLTFCGYAMGGVFVALFAACAWVRG